MTWDVILCALLVIWALLSGPIYIYLSLGIPLTEDWRLASRESAKLAPEPHAVPEALIQAYAARAFNWRGLFATHAWIAVKAAAADHYVVYQIAGWRKYSKLPVLVIEADIPDRLWFGNQPEVIAELRGPMAEKAIARLAEISEHYPYRYKYVLWPGPNSNSYMGYVGRQIPELRLNLPSISLGKDYLIKHRFYAKAPSGTGIQISFKGIFGILIAGIEGVELNILTQVVGFSWYDGLALKWPGVGKFYLFGQPKQKFERLPGA